MAARVGWVGGAVLALALLLAPAGAEEEDRRRPAPGPHEDKQPPGTPNVHCESTKGPFVIEMHPEWAPLGAQRFIDAINETVFDDTVIYRVVKNEAVQFGFPKDPVLNGKWRSMKPLKDDPQPFHNPNFHRGMIAYAGSGHNSRGIDVFITFMTGNANGTPRAPWESPFGIVDEAGMKHVTAFNSEYGDFQRFGGNGPDLSKGYEAMKTSHPNIDYLGKCTLVYPSDAQVSTRIAVGAVEMYEVDEPSTSTQRPNQMGHQAQAGRRGTDTDIGATGAAVDGIPEGVVEMFADETEAVPGGSEAVFNDGGGGGADEATAEVAGRGDGTWITVALGNGTTVSFPLMPYTLAAAGVLVCCFRRALPKLSKRLWRRVVSCDL